MKKLFLILVVLGFVFSACEVRISTSGVDTKTTTSKEEKYPGLNLTSSSTKKIRTKPIDREMMKKMITSETGTPLDRKFQEKTALERLKEWKRNLRWNITCKKDGTRMECKREHDGIKTITKFECSVGELNYAKFAYYDCISERGRRTETMCQITKDLGRGWKEYFCGYWQGREK